MRQPEGLVLAVSLVILCPALVWTCLAPSKTGAIAGLFVVYPFAFGFTTPGTLLVQAAVSDDLRGIGVGLWASVTNVVSLTLVLPLVGFASDLLTARYGVYGLAYALAGSSGVGLVGALLLVRARRALLDGAPDHEPAGDLTEIAT